MLTEEVAQLTLQLEAARSSSEEGEPSEAELDEMAADEREHGARAWFRRTLGMGPEDDAEALDER